MTEVRNSEADLQRFQRRLLAVMLVVLIGFGLLVWRLHILQVQRHEAYLERAETNRTAVLPITPHRGEILDRNGEVLAANYRAYTLEVTPSRLKRPLDEVLDEVSQIVEITPRDRRRFRRLREDARNFDSVLLRSGLSDEEVARFAAQHYRFEGVNIRARLLRHYPQGEAAAHVVGYIGRINQREKERLADSEEAANYRGAEYIGKLGIEASYESTLRGQTGFQQMETSAGGYAVRNLATHPATPGDSVRLSIDIHLQKLVERMYGERRGALVALDPRNGEVLAFVSKPTYDPNLFVDGIDQESWDELNQSIDKPLLNRALRGLYPPGSTYKPFMGLAALETGARTAASTIQDNGSWTFGGHTFRSGHALGPVNLHRSIVRSSNVYYYMLANDMGVNAIHDFMKPLGFGQITGLDLPGEARGILPSTDWKRRAYKRPNQQKWYAGETISLGIGQGYNSFTMLQLAAATAALANGGTWHTPHIARQRQDALTGALYPIELPAPRPLGYKPAHVEAVKRGMVGVTLEGTSRAVFAGAPYLSGGKTGTAQAITIGQKSRYNAAKLAEHQRDHSLYIAFAPAQDPRIAVAVIVENAGYGAAHAAPLARRVMDYWLAGIYPSEADIAALQKGRASAPIGPARRVSEVTGHTPSGQPAAQADNAAASTPAPATP